MWIVLMILGCTAEEDSGKTVASDACDAMMCGVLRPEGQDVSGEFGIVKAFAFDTDNMMGAYLSSNPNATCANVVEHLNISGTAHNPENVVAGGMCNMFIKLTTGYDGGLSAVNDKMVAISSGIECAMGEGEFQYSELGEGDIDYFWTGNWWVGNVEEYSWELQGNVESGYTFDISLHTSMGSFLQEEFANYPATGDVSGVVTAEPCAAIFSTGHFN